MNTEENAGFDEEDVTALKFPKEFENEDTLLNVEVALLLESRKKQNDKGGQIILK